MEKYKEVYQQMKSSDNLIFFVQERKKQLYEESVNEYKGSEWSKGRRVGPNENARYQTSSCSEFLSEDRIISVESGFEGIILKTGNLDAVYSWMFKNLSANDMENCSPEKLAVFVSMLSDSYFGPNYDNKARMNVFNLAEPAELNMFRGRNAAKCVERATLCHSFFKMLGIDATLKQSKVDYNGDDSVHAYNIIRVNGQNLVFDTSIPKRDAAGTKDPIVGSLSDKEYMLMVDGRPDVGCHTTVMNNGTIYNSSFKSCEEELERMPLEKVEEIMAQARFINSDKFTKEDVVVENASSSKK